MHGTTTGKEIFEEVSKYVTEMKLPWDKLVRLMTDGAPAMCYQKSGLVGRIWEKMRENHAGKLTVYHCIMHQESLCEKALKMGHVMSTITRVVIRAKGLNHCQFKSFLEEIGLEYRDMLYHTEVRWLSRGKVLNRCLELHEEICQFMESKGKDTTELQDKKFLCELVFLCDILNHLNVLNLQLQGWDRVITDMYAAMRAFKTKLCLWETQMLQGNLAIFRAAKRLKSRSLPTSFQHSMLKNSAHSAPSLTGNLPTLNPKKCRFELLSNLFAVDVKSAPTNLQMELIELQCCDTLKSKYDSVGSAQFPRFIPNTMPQLCTQAAQTQCPNSVPKLLKCSLCLAAHIYGNSYSL